MTVLDAITGLRQLLAERDVEIERLKEENAALLFTYQQLETEWYAQQKLITDLADALVYLELGKIQQIEYHDNTKLIRRAREGG